MTDFIEVEGPGGVIVEFPAGTSREVMTQAMRKRFGGGQAAPAGHLRPFKSGEFVKNDDGSISTERTVTVPHPSGGWMNVPSLWMGPNGPVDLADNEDGIFDAVTKYGANNFTSFSTVDEAVAEAKRRSNAGGAFSGAQIPAPARSMQEHFADAGVRSPIEDRTKMGNIGHAVAQGATFGTADEIRAGVKALPALLDDRDFSQEYDRNLGEERAALANYRRENPKTAFAAEVAGSILPASRVGSAAVGALKSLSPAASLTAQGAVAGAVPGAMMGAGAGEGGIGERAKGAATGGLLGGVLGAGTSAVAGKMQAGAERAAVTKNAPTIDGLRGDARALYSSVEQKGLNIAPKAYDILARRLSFFMQKERLNPRLHPKAIGVMEEVDRIKGGAVSLLELDDVRRVAQGAAQSADPDDARLIGKVVEEIDNLIDNLKPGQTTAGSLSAAKDLKSAREVWRRVRKSEVVEEAMRRAELAASGPANGLRQEFRAIMKNAKRRKMFDGDELKAMAAVVRGGPAENFLKLVGRGAFGANGAGNFLGGSVAAGAGATVAGPAGAVIAPVIGYGARKQSEAMTAKSAEYLAARVRSGQALSAANMARINPALRERIAAMIAGDAGAAGAIADPLQTQQQ